MQKNTARRSQGADLIDGGVRYRTWAPGKKNVEALIYDGKGAIARRVELRAEPVGYFSAVDARGEAGDLYKYHFDGRDFPDPAARFNPAGMHGASQVVDPNDFSWRDLDWKCPPFSELVIYELHLGAFTSAGTFRGAIERLDHLVRLGANAIEIMPVADFPGERNWGYDGVLIYAPARAYGAPNDFRALVDAAHAHGIAVILDVVFNHLGPDGNYLGYFSREYFHRTHKTPWGDGFDFELEPVREFFAENPEYWRREFHIDGFRLDATHAIVDSSPHHFLSEVADRIHSLGGFITAEDERHEPKLLQPSTRGGIGLDACWADDFHHVVRVMLTGEREGYFQSYEGTPEELSETLRDGWLLFGRKRQRKGADEMRECAALAPEQFIFCISNHDQIGNEAFGSRLNQKISPAAYRAASALLLLAPCTPLLFMGQEWSASTPFLFFTDHEPALGRRVAQGRREEFRGFPAFRDAKMRERIPDPQTRETFLRSKLRWEEIEQASHQTTFRLYEELLRLRRSLPALRDRARGRWRVLEPKCGIVRLIFGEGSGEECLLLADLVGGHADALRDDDKWELLLSTNEKRFGGDAGDPFAEPEARLLRAKH
ncbi:MAG TPA: malto-oligosyltrehalose trehalohydrolase [Chthoniobacterales bacterium]|jgi:maltooligosyltrehalose trehalohydrolase